jgi:hypothetical protein
MSRSEDQYWRCRERQLTEVPEIPSVILHADGRRQVSGCEIKCSRRSNSRFTEGFGTADLKVAKALLEKL